MNLESCEEGYWIYLVQFRNRRRGAVLTAVDLWVESMTDCRINKKLRCMLIKVGPHL